MGKCFELIYGELEIREASVYFVILQKKNRPNFFNFAKLNEIGKSKFRLIFTLNPAKA